MTQKLHLMRWKNSGILTLLFLLMHGLLFALPQAQYRTQTNGDWNTASNWQTSSNGTTWATASAAPTSANASSITVSNTMTIAANTTSTTGTITINSGASVTINSGGTLTLGGSVTDNGSITVATGGTLNCTAYVISTSSSTGGNFTLSTGGTLYIGNANGIASTGSTGNIQVKGTRSFSAGANYVYNGTVQQSTGTGLPTGTISGNITIQNNNSLGVTLTNNVIISSTSTFSVGSGYTVNCGTNTISGAGAFTLASGGTIIIGSTAGITSSGATGNIQVTGTRSFNTAANYNYTSSVAGQVTGNGLPSTLTGNVIINNTYVAGNGVTLSSGFAINTPGVVTVNGILSCGTYIISGTGTFTLSAGGTLQTSNTAGITSPGNATGAIQTTTRNYNASANYGYTGSVQQVTGNGMPTTVNNLTINNSNTASSPSYAVQLTSNVTINGTLALTNGLFCLNGNTVTIGSNATISRTTGSIEKTCGGSAGTITFSGMVNLTYLGTSATSITVGPEMPSSSSALGILTVNANGGITLSSSITVNTQLIMTEGIITPGSYTLTYASGATLMYNGAAAQTVTNVEWPLTFNKNITIYNTLTTGSTPGVVLNTTKTNYTGNLTIVSGGVFNVATYAVEGSGTFTQNAGGTFVTAWTTGVVNTAGVQLTGGITYSTGGNFEFDGTSAQVTGTAMPKVVNSITIYNSAGVSLSQSTENTGAYSSNPYYSLILTSGAFSIGADTLSIDAVIASPAISVGTGTLTGGSTSSIYFDGSNSYPTVLPAVSGGLSVLAVNRTNGNITLGANITINDTLDMWAGTLNIANGTMTTMTLGGTINEISGSLYGGTFSNITVTDNANIVYFPNIQTGLNNLTINRPSSGAALAAGLTISGTLTLSNGIFYLQANTLTMNGAISSGSGSMQGGIGSAMVVGGTGSQLSLPAITNGIDNLTLSRSNGLVLSGNNDISGLLTLTSGIFSIGAYTLEMDSFVTIGSGSSIHGGSTSNVTIGGSSSPFYMPAIVNGINNFTIIDAYHVSLTSNLVVNSSITLIVGGIFLNQYNLTLQTANAIYGGGTSGYWIMSNQTPGNNGSLVQYAGGTPVYYPVGTYSSFTPVTVNNTGTADSFYVNVLDGVYDNGTSGSTIPSINFDVNKTWVVSEKHRGYGNATLTVQWNIATDENIDFVEAGSGISSYYNGGWDVSSESNFNNTSNPGIVTVSRSGIDSFHAFGIGKTLTPLPVSLLYFNGVLVNKEANLAWSTATEINNDHFTLERSADGKNFTPLASIKGAGNSVTVQNYEYTDQEPLSGVSYYRLAQTDIDGTETYVRNIVEINNDGTENGIKELSVQPNPFKSTISVNFNSMEGGIAQIAVSDLSGKVAYSESVPYQQGSNLLPLNLDNLNDGVYILKMQMDNTLNTLKIVKYSK